MKLSKIGYELCDVNVIQHPRSQIRSRLQDCNPYVSICDRKVLPVIVAPMASVTDENNYKLWLDNDFICVVPRSVDYEKRLKIMYETFCSFSLDEAESIANDDFNKIGYVPDTTKFYICVDIAHGTMEALYNVCRELKNRFGKDVVIMTGNVGTPDAYSIYADIGIDYMRVTIGNGSCCTTSANVGIHYPAATLLDELATNKTEWEYERQKYNQGTKLILDGGLSNFDDINKALALGAYAVMSGSFFAKAKEASGTIRYFLEKPEPSQFTSLGIGQMMYETQKGGWPSFDNYKPFRLYYGMSTKLAQKQCGSKNERTSEGILKVVPVEYSISKWKDNLDSYIRSAMSYTNSRTLTDYRKNTVVIINASGDKTYRK